jgi:hypothetical protein
VKQFYVEPEVAGGLGGNTEMDRSVRPPAVTRLHYVLDGWLGDVLLETYPCFIVTEKARQGLEEAGVSGVDFDDVEVTTSDQFRDLHPSWQLPKFYWLKISGKTTQDDFRTAPEGRMIVSERALEVLRRLGIANAVIAPL